MIKRAEKDYIGHILSCAECARSWCKEGERLKRIFDKGRDDANTDRSKNSNPKPNKVFI